MTLTDNCNFNTIIFVFTGRLLFRMMGFKFVLLVVFVFLLKNQGSEANRLYKPDNNAAAVTSSLDVLHSRFKLHPSKVDVFCQTCHDVVNHVIEYRRTGASKASMIDYLNKICNLFSNYGADACQGYVNIEIDTVLFILDNKQNLTSTRVCGIYFQAKGCIDPNATPWKINIPPPRAPKNVGASKVLLNSDGKKHLKILHLTDLHYDPLYKPGSNSKCDKPLCCEEINGIASDPSNAAGYWGDYNVCDMPWHSVGNLIAEINSRHNDIDLIYFTGDIISHNSWSTSKSSNSKTLTKMYNFLKESFKNITIFPILGNHESHPVDAYSPVTAGSLVSSQWLFELIATEWGKWLPLDARETIMKGGYYTVLVRPGFRVVALNSNVAFTSNLWLTYEDEDLFDQLKWLVSVLSEAEKNSEKVHLLSHIPPGDLDCIKQWSFNLKKIIIRFSTTLVAQFNGHTHYDEFRVFYSTSNPSEVIHVAYNGGSFTTFVGMNPNYRTYDVDYNTLEVQDYDHFIYNLTKANMDSTIPPEWYKLYSFQSAYKMENLNLTTFGDLVNNRLSTDKSLLEQYFRYRVRDSDPEITEGCDNKCLQNLLCHIKASDATHALSCEHI